MLLTQLLKGKKVILASGSPRRHELLRGLGIDFTIDTDNSFEEVYPKDLHHGKIPQYLARGKSYGYHRALEENEILITADTMVVCGGHIMGKPKDRKEAVAMLKELQDNRHTVLTGVCIRSREKERLFTCASTVWFGRLSKEEIDYYIDNYRPFDKAGSYGVQEWIGYVAIKGIEGSYFNVMGLPVQRLYTELKKFVTGQESPLLRP
ncbi:MAG: septum formation protein Maf [Bacteroidetes bacterium]|uniref:dTTP/UTP pyrophosphatase n=1 Tax=Candidatus Egerieousia excrementavium TaxID=2840778 RepID=A0A9D9GVB7_9BACT|nr:septum formation protein Maf [Candidatus Egerieousia excrementavium]